MIEQHVQGKGYKTNSKQFEVPLTTAAQITDWRNLHGHGHKRKTMSWMTDNTNGHQKAQNYF